MDPRNKYYITAVKTAIKEVLRCTDPAFTEEIFSFFSALFLKAYQRPLSNCKSKFRTFFTKYCELAWERSGRLFPFSNNSSLSVHQKMKELLKVAGDIGAWTCPTVDDIIEATRKMPGDNDVTDKDRDAMHLFLMVAFSSLDARLEKQWKKGTTHMKFFSRTYAYEVGVAFLLIAHFSDTQNILYNAGLVDEDGNRVEAQSLDEVQKPKRKKRKKMQTAENSLEHQKAYYKYVKLIKDEMKRPGFEERMRAWDAGICDTSRCKDKDTTPTGETPTTRLNTAPLEYLKSRDSGYSEHSEADEFFQASGLFPSFSLGSAASISSVSTSGSPMPPLPSTQQSPPTQQQVVSPTNENHAVRV